MGGSSGSSGGSSTTTTAPWTGVQPQLNQAYGDAQIIYDQRGLHPNYYPTSTVQPLSDKTWMALDMQASAAGGPMQADLTDGRDMMHRTLGGEYLGANPVNGYLGGIASGGTNQAGVNSFASLLGSTPTSGQQMLGQLSGQFQAPTTGTMMLSDMASSGATNPYLDAMYQKAAGQVASGINGQASLAGRYGSGAQAAATGDAMNNLATQMYGQAYNDNMNRQLSASQSLASAQSQQQAQQLAAAQGYSSAEQAAQQERLTAAQGLQSGLSSNTQNQIQAANVIGNSWDAERQRQIQSMMFSPTMTQAEVLPAQAMSEVGNTLDTYGQNLINADIQRYNYNANANLIQLQQYLNLLQGAGSLGGVSTTQTQSAPRNALGSVIGGGLAGAGSGAMIGTAIMPGIGTAIGAGAGGLLGAAGGFFGSR